MVNQVSSLVKNFVAFLRQKIVALIQDTSYNARDINQIPLDFMEYTIIQEETLEELMKQINLLIERGWQPHGGVSVTQQLCERTQTTSTNYSTLYDAGLIYAQAMTRSENKPQRESQ